MTKAIYFDMDNTVADLYGVENWEPMLRAEIITPYEVAAPMYDMVKLDAILEQFKGKGWSIEVISWGAMDCSAAYDVEVERVKAAWIDKYMPSVSAVHVVPYGTPKHKVAGSGVLVDDNAEVRHDWEQYSAINTTIDATKNILEELKNLLAMID